VLFPLIRQQHYIYLDKFHEISTKKSHLIEEKFFSTATIELLLYNNSIQIGGEEITC